jgi:hypothetical protein
VGLDEVLHEGEEGGGVVVCEGPKEGGVSGFDEGEGLLGDVEADGGEGEEASATIGGVDGAGEQALFFEGAHDLGGHHEVGVRVVGEEGLSDRGTGLLMPRDTCEEDELDVGEAEGGKCCTDMLLPEVGELPEEEARAVVGVVEAGEGHWRSPSEVEEDG